MYFFSFLQHLKQASLSQFAHRTLANKFISNGLLVLFISVLRATNTFDKEQPTPSHK